MTFLYRDQTREGAITRMNYGEDDPYYFPSFPTLRQIRSRRLNALIAADRAETHAEERSHGEHAIMELDLITPPPPFTHAQVHSLSREDLAAAVCNALTVVELGPAAVGQSLLHQIRVSLIVDGNYPEDRSDE